MLKFVPGSDDYSVPSSTGVEPIAEKNENKSKNVFEKVRQFPRVLISENESSDHR